MAVDSVQELLDIVEGAWTEANTDSKTPRFAKAWGETPMRVSVMLATPDRDLITFYETTAPQEPSGSMIAVGGTKLIRHTSNLRIDIRSVNTEAHALKVKEEVLRILVANMSAPAGSFDKLLPPFDLQNLTDKGKRVYRYVISCRLVTHRRTYT